MMTFQDVPGAIPVGVAAAISLVLATLARPRRAMPLAVPFGVMMTGETIWALGDALEPVIDLNSRSSGCALTGGCSGR